jgi:glucose-1-phosphate thymidylyltransferase
VANKPVLFYGLDAIAEAGVREVGIVVGDTAAEVRRAVGNGSRFGLDVTYLPQEAPLGLAHAVRVAREYLGDDSFLMYLGDNFLVGGISEIVQRFRSEGAEAHLLLTKVSRPQVFGVAEIDATGRIVSVEEKPKEPKSDLAVAGIYLFTPVVHEIIRDLQPSRRGELEITDAIQRMIERGHRIEATVVSGYWKDTGSVDDVLEVNRLVLESVDPVQEGIVEDSEIIGRVAIEKGATIRRSQIVGPAVIAAGTIISDSYIGPFTSVAQDCRIADSEIEYSIVLDGVHIDGIRRIERSLIGREATVTPSARPRQSHQLVLGDHSRVQIRA